MKRARLHASKKALQQRQQMQQQQSVACDGFWCVPTPDGAPVLLRGDAELASVVHVANLEPGVTADDVKDALGASEATLGPLAGQARLTFASEAEAAAALQRGPVVVPRSDALRGWDRWVAACQAKPDPVALAREVDEFMARFDAQAAQAAQRARVQQVDDDGFVLVTRKRGRRAAKDAAGDFGVKATTAKKKHNTTNTTVPSLYGYLEQQRKVQQLATLRTRFAADKERLAALRPADRKFRP